MKDSGARVICLVRDEDWPENLELRRFLDNHGLECRVCPFGSYPTWRYWRYWPHVALENLRAFTVGNHRLKQICLEVEATHIHSFNPFLTLSFWRALNTMDVPLIYRCGEAPVAHNAFYRAIWRWLCRRVSHVGTESNYLISLLVEQGFNLKQISLTRTPPPARTIVSAFSNPSGSERSIGIRFVYVGQIAIFKGVSVLLDAMELVRAQFHDATLLLAGSLDSHEAKSLQAKAERQFEVGAVSFLGAVEDVPGVLRICDAHIAPSLKPEGYGLVAVEAKQAGLPSIVFAGGGLSELIEDGVDGIVVQNRSSEDLANAMLAYCRKPERGRIDGTRARASLTERLQTDQYAQRWRAIYKETMPR